MVRRGLAVLSAVAVVTSLGLAAPTASQANDAPEPRVAPMAPSPMIAGTPLEILNETPVTEGLAVGYEAGMFIPAGSFTKKDARGCLYKKQLLIAMAVKKPSIGPGCKLSGGEWLADFGTKRVKNWQDIDIGQLLPDKFVYAQGARNWTEQQRRQYGQWDGSGVIAPRAASMGFMETSNIQIITRRNVRFMETLNNTLDQGVSKDSGQFEAQLEALRQQNPGLFDSWSVATLLNVKQWGLSLNPGTAADFQVSIRECSAKTSTTINGTAIKLTGGGKSARPVSQIQSMVNPCSNMYSVPNLAARFEITPVPVTASAAPGIDNQVLSGYGTPQGPAISRFLFGMHAPAHWTSDRASGYDGPIEASSIPTVPVGSTRLWDTETAWADIEPERGQFTYSKLAKQIEMAQRLDARPMLVLGGTPNWAGSGGRNSVPNSVDDYKNYVRAVACHFGESIFAYEVWNEANIKDFWAGNAEQMADLTAAAFEAVRGCNPNALVVAASTTTRATGSFSTFYPAYLEELKKRNWPVDAYSVHSYPAASGGADARIRGIGQFKTMLALAGAPKTTIFDTETNYGLAGLGEPRLEYANERAQALIARTYIDSARYGFDSTYWFVWTRGEDSKYGIQMNPGSGAAHTAWQSTYDWIVGAQFQRCLETEQGITVCQFNKGAENFSIIWHGDVGTQSIQVESSQLTGLGSRACTLNNECYDLNPQVTSSILLSFAPVRIDGAPLSSGPADVEEPLNGSLLLAPPIVKSVDVNYVVANKITGIATWEAPIGTSSDKVTGYSYTWYKCKSRTSCEQRKVIAQGRVNAKTLRSSVPLTAGAGNYLFTVSAFVTRNRPTGGTFVSDTGTSSQSFTVFKTAAVPPDNVVMAISGTPKRGEISWDAPLMKKDLIAGYEVQVTNPDGGSWKTLKQVKGLTATFSPEELGIDLQKEVIARVRTVLKSGAKSPFAQSNFVFAGAPLAPPVVQDAVLETGVLYVTTEGTSALFPSSGYQVRYSANGGAWQMAIFAGSLPGNLPSANPYLAPFGERVLFAAPTTKPGFVGEQFPLGTLTFETRSVTEGELPGEWVPFDFTFRSGAS